MFGLHLTLQRGQVISWSVGLFLAGLAFGSMTKSLLDAAKQNELIRAPTGPAGHNGIYTTMTQFLAAAATAYVVIVGAAGLRDEESGLGEPVLAGAVSRWRWLTTAVAAALAGSVVLMFFAGLGNGLGARYHARASRKPSVPRLTLRRPGVRACTGSAGRDRRRSPWRCGDPWIGWLAVIFVVTSLYLGALLRLPRWLLDLSPVGRTTVPSHFPAATLAVMVVGGNRADRGRRLDLP